MKTVQTAGVFAYILFEEEWYAVDDEQREYMKMKAMLAAQEAGCIYLSIFVDPDPLFSDLTDKKRHRVFKHTFSRPVDDDFYRELTKLVGAFVQPGKLSITEAKTIALKVFG